MRFLSLSEEAGIRKICAPMSIRNVIVEFLSMWKSRRVKASTTCFVALIVNPQMFLNCQERTFLLNFVKNFFCIYDMLFKSIICLLRYCDQNVSFTLLVEKTTFFSSISCFQFYFSLHWNFYWHFQGYNEVVCCWNRILSVTSATASRKYSSYLSVW